MKNLVSTIIVFFSSICAIVSQSYDLRSYSIEEGLTNPFVYTFEQHSHGYLWIGTGEGLFKFDGETFFRYSQKDGLAQNLVTSSLLFGDELFVGHIDGSISKVENKGIKEVKKKEQFDSKIVSIEDLGDHGIWAISQNAGLAKIENDKVATYLNPFTDEVHITAAYVFQDKLCLGTHEGIYIFTIQEIDDGVYDFNKIYNNDTLGRVGAIEAYSKNELVISTDEYALQKITFSGSKAMLKPFLNRIVPETMGVNHILVDVKKNIWLAKMGYGLYKVVYNSKEKAHKSYQSISDKAGRDISLVSCTFQDNENSLWLGTFGNGAFHFIESNFAFYLQQEEEANVAAIVIKDSMHYAAVKDQIIITSTVNSKQQKLSLEDGLPDDNVTTIAITDKNHLVIGYEYKGLWKYSPDGAITTYNDNLKNRLSQKIIQVLQKKDTLFVATFSGLYILNTKGELITHFSTKNGLRHNVVNTLFLDSQERLWIGSRSNNITLLDQKLQLSEYKLPSNMFLNKIVEFTEDKNGNIWLATLGDGVYKLDKDSISSFNAQKGLLSDYCYTLEADLEGNVWVGHKGGLSKIMQDEIAIFSSESGISLEFNKRASEIDKYGALWFGTQHGIVQHINRVDKVNVTPPVPTLSNVFVNDSLYAEGEEVKLNFGDYKLDFEVEAISLAHPRDVSYHYILEGFEKTWHKGFSHEPITYKKVMDGEYQLKVKACSKTGVCSEPIIVTKLIVKAPFWKSIWFYLILILLIALVVMGVIYWREKRNRALMQLLKAKIDERTKELKRKNEDLTSSIEYAKLIQEALLPETSFLSKFFKDQLVFYKPKDIVSGDFYWFGMVDGKVIVAVGDCTGHGVPGGFMTMLGVNLMNTIVNERGITDPAMILTYLHVSMIEALGSDKEGSFIRDGMDIAICCYERETDQLIYAGARRPLLIIENGEVKQIKATRCSIGDFERKMNYSNHFIRNTSSKSYYIFSDGVVDQFGGEKEKKFSTQRLSNLLADHQKMSMREQRDALNNAMNEWMVDFPDQIDDMLLVGFRVN